MTEIMELMEELREKDDWDTVYLVRNREDFCESTGIEPFAVRNHTDEGLGADRRLLARGETAREALQNALDGNFERDWS